MTKRPVKAVPSIVSPDDLEMVNSLSSLCGTLSQNNLFDGAQQISNANTLFLNNRWYLISNFRQLLSQMYVEHGIVQTMVDQPVDDGFSPGFEIKTSELSGEEIEQLEVFNEQFQVTGSIKQGSKWARLFGGGGVLIVTDQDPATPLNIEAIDQNTPLEFRSVDMWELYYDQQNINSTMDVGGAMGENVGEFFNYYGIRVHTSRVYRITGKPAPSFIRPRLRGWGMSELERLVRSLNQYLKNQDLIFELLDEAKVDVYRVKGFNAALTTATGTGDVAKRIQGANQIKNFQHAVVMDIGDEYEQKQIAFAGLAEMLTQIRQGIAADLKMPLTKIFGVSSAGFNSGEDDIENYNSMVEGEVRAKVKFIIVDLLKLSCQKLFGYAPQDLMIEWNSMRILNAKEQEEVKDSQHNRVMATYQSGLIPAQEAKQSINKSSLLPVEIDENAEADMPIGGDFTVGGAAKGKGGKQTPDEA